ncbi:hypothetical protein SERLA73DRAFT_131831 [Serpula lacrymans var. lacrymans S7.3]|uniref:Uncharacterized protein n=2 Tax=Serpula lacrymans var. lacrymans TaxID=341189 RepID=F8PQ55_SERL3|nr:uncharacterized protein SERLADRAFT_381490 [Serpula lacrymans var. lacrymans S7.9]EGO01520.1 hypothetical protein SERLA73DRAFT_131831 [Serpula lacrymans var. lacrymans S7.3]EGO27173.1 hypothetical protein SERLADRAFT_381490 [Serpula lacrymans var. lacrymans S7.9]
MKVENPWQERHYSSFQVRQAIEHSALNIRTSSTEQVIFSKTLYGQNCKLQKRIVKMPLS